MKDIVCTIYKKDYDTSGIYYEIERVFNKQGDYEFVLYSVKDSTRTKIAKKDSPLELEKLIK